MRFSFVLVLGLVLVAGLFFVIPNRGNTTSYSGDFLVHYSKSANLDYSLVGIDGYEILPETFGVYPPLFHFVASLWSFRLEFFYLFVLTMFFVVAPLWLYFWFRHWFVGLAWFAFSAVWGFSWGMITQGMATLLFVPFIFYKRIWFRTLLLLISLLLHSHAFWLFASYWVFELVWDNRKELLYLGACVLPIPVNKPVEQVVEEVKSQTGNSVFSNVFGSNSTIPAKGLLGTNYVLVARWFPFNPLVVFSFFGLWKKNRKWLVYCVLVILAGAGFLWFRVVESLAPFFVFGLTYYYVGSGKRMKKFLVVACLLIIFMLFLHQLSLMRLIGFSLSGSLECVVSWIG